LRIEQVISLETLEQLKKLREEYERLRDQSFLTGKPEHFMRLQQVFRDYRSFIDQHNIPPGEIESIISVDLRENQQGRVAREDHFSQKPPLQRAQAVESGQKILDFVRKRDGFMTIRDIASHIPLSVCQIRRHLWRLHEKGLIEQHGRYLWSKKRNHG
jgi:Bacterial regulatory protein, arsR family